MSRFQAVDHDRQGSDLVAYLDSLAGLPAVQEMRRLAFDVVADGSPKKILDLGCGTGETTRSLSEICTGCLVVGLDRSTVLLETAKVRHPTNTFVHGDALALDAGCAWDACYSERLLMHIHDLDACLRSIERALAPGGLLVSVEPNWRAAHWKGFGDPVGSLFLTRYLEAIAQPAAPEKITESCSAMGWRQMSGSSHMLTAVSFVEADAVIRFRNALVRQGASDAALPRTMERLKADFQSFVLPFTVQAWRT
jgi:ubiquinone/menaquinone biosynthesis C-methylase UbiE